MLTEIRQTEKDKHYTISHVQSQKRKNQSHSKGDQIWKEAGALGGALQEGGQNGETPSWKISNSQGGNAQDDYR